MTHPLTHCPRNRLTMFLATLALTGLAFTAAPAGAGTAPAAPWPEVLTLNAAARYLQMMPGELAALAEEGEVPARRLGAGWRFSRDALQAWLIGDWKLVTVALAPGAAALPQDRMAAVTGTGTTGGAAGSAPAPASGEPIGEAPEESTAEDVFLRRQRVLLAPGDVNLDFSLFYASSDSRQLALSGNNIGLATLEQDTFTAGLLARYGVAEETELFAGTSYRFQDTDLVLGDSTIESSTFDEFGDIRLGVRRTLMHEGTWRPNVVATLEGRVPTGHSSYALGGGLSFVKSYDPAVLFASANYRHTFSREFGDVTRLEPEDRIDATFGYALALNDTLSISTALSGLFTFGTKFDDVRLRASDQFSLQFGLTALAAEGLYIEPTVSFGLNGPGDSFAVGLTVPYSF